MILLFIILIYFKYLNLKGNYFNRIEERFFLEIECSYLYLEFEFNKKKKFEI